MWWLGRLFGGRLADVELVPDIEDPTTRNLC